MKFTAEKNDLSRAVTFASQGVNPRSPGILMRTGDNLTVAGSDGYVTFASVLDGTYDPGQAVFPGIFPQIISLLPGETVTISLEGTTAEITSGRSKYILQVLPAENYPHQVRDIPPVAEVNGDDFRKALKQVLPASDPNNPVPALTGIQIQAMMHLELLATDKYALGWAGIKYEMTENDYSGSAAVIPGTVARKLTGTEGNLSIGWDGGLIQFRFSSGSTITARMIDGKFPAWKVPRMDQWAPVSRDVISAVKRASLTGSAVTLDFGDVLSVESSGQAGTYSEAISIGYNRQTRLTVSPEMLLNGLQGCDHPEIAFTSADKPVYIRDEGFVWALMPRKETT